MLPPFLFVALCVVASHYFRPGVKKLELGPNWVSWLRWDQLTNLTVGAYRQGWLAFQLAIFALSGILFWQYIATNLMLGAVIASLPPHLLDASFGPVEGLVAIALVFAFPHQRRIWKPIRLGWWDSALSARLGWEVRGRSGAWYGLHNNFMCPHERIFGQRYGAFLVHDLRITDPMGEVESFEIFRALAAARSPADIAAIKRKFGSDPYDADLSEEHHRYLRSFLEGFNSGNPKRVCPWWLKAPGGQRFYWSRLPAFKGQEAVDRLVVRYREDFYDGKEIIAIEDRVVHIMDLALESEV